MVNKKRPSIWFQHEINFRLRSRNRASLLHALIALINRSNMPVSRAMVPPDTPGTTLAAPMRMPFMSWINICCITVVYYEVAKQAKV